MIEAALLAHSTRITATVTSASSHYFFIERFSSPSVVCAGVCGDGQPGTA